MRIKNKLRAIFAGTIWVWGLMVVAAQYNLVTDPEYDSMAPATSIAAGWLPGGIYASLCVLVAFVCSHALVSFKTRKNREQSDGHQSMDQPR